jgi:hypothetical protein
MLDSFAAYQPLSVRDAECRAVWGWRIMFLALVGISVALSTLLVRKPSPSMLSWSLFAIAVVAVFWQPRYGIYLILGLTLFADSNLHPWFPFTKNLSSRESLMYVADSLIISPLEIFIALTAMAWFGRMALERRIRIYTGVLFWPALALIVMVTLGLVYGLSRGGNTVIALWETRPIYYLLALLFLTSNLVKTRQQINNLLWIIAIALFLKAVAGVNYVATVLHWDVGSVENIAEHSMSIHFNAFFALLMATWMYRGSIARRILMPLMMPFVVYSLAANHRRAGFLTLGIILALVVLMLYRENRKLFWAIAPTSLIAFLIYLAAFWNNTGGIGSMARAVRSVVGQPTARDASSNIYRDLENINIMYTIKTAPLQGVGFGQKFHIFVPMADISTFEWWEYITHNSIMWIWMQIGVVGFFAMLLMLGLAMMLGGRLIMNMPRGFLRMTALTATLYVMSHFVFAYVDMSWDISSMVFVGTMMGIINILARIAAVPVPVPPKRWPWQPDPEPREAWAR